MPFLDIEEAIKESSIGSRFRLVNIASQRARELNTPSESTVKSMVNDKDFTKVTTIALKEVIDHDMIFETENPEIAMGNG
jgi:DNA-directed RNA polymerase omega subunit